MNKYGRKYKYFSHFREYCWHTVSERSEIFLNTDAKTYRKYACARAGKSPLVKDTLTAFVSGGLICLSAQLLKNGYLAAGLTEEMAGTAVSVTLIGTAVLLTAFGVFDRIARRTGAGTLVPITGFANAVASSAIDARSEGFIMGVGAKIFQIAGPVITYGLSAGVVYGFVYWLLGLL